MKNYLLLILLTVFCNSLYAQKEKLSPEQQAENMVQKISERTFLLPTKKDSLTDVFTDYYKNLETYRKNGSEKVIKAVEKTKDTKVKNLLTSDQYEIYTEILNEEKAKRAKEDEKKNVPGMPRSGSMGSGGGNSNDRSRSKW